MQKNIIYFGLTITVIGLLWPWLGKLPLGRLPGDIIVDKPRLKIFFPVTTTLLASALLSIILWLLRK